MSAIAYDQYGPVKLPQSEQADAFVTPDAKPFDPVIEYLRSYMQTVANARLRDDFQTLFPNMLPVANTFDFSPEEGEFNERDLPALFVWSQEGEEPIRVCDAFRVEERNVTALWIPPPVPQARRAPRMGFPNELAKVWDAAIEINRDASWRVDGDTEPQAIHLGSSLFRYMNVWRIEKSKWKRQPVQIAMDDGTGAGSLTRTYFGISTTIRVWEHLVRDLAIYDDIVEVDIHQHGADLGVGDGGVVFNDMHFTL